MAATTYAKHVGGRQSKHMSREEYQSRRTEFALRGQELGQSKLCDLDVVAIRSAARQRESLRNHIRETLSNDALAKQFGVHVRSVEKILTRETWSHIE